MSRLIPSPQFLAAFTRAWNEHDADLLMTFMTPDCIFDTSAGLLIHGSRFEGFEAVKKAYASIWAMYPDAQWLNDTHFVAGNKGVSEWTFRGNSVDGLFVETRGCDIFLFQDDKIHVKDSFRKQRVQPPA